MQYKVSSYISNNDDNENNEHLACAYVQAVFMVSLHMRIPFSLQKISGFHFILLQVKNLRHRQIS